MKSYDIAVIGSGPGGYIAAIRAAQLGMTAAIVEKDRLGGVCLNWGCIPSKAILSAAEVFEAVKGGTPGLVVDGLRADYPAVIDASRKAADRLNRGVASLMKKNQIDVIEGRGRLSAGGGGVIVQNGDVETEIDAGNVILATGSQEFVFPGVEVDGNRVLTSREALALRELPSSVVVVGGGAVGLEFAYAYATFGSEVTVIEMAEQLLPGFDVEIARALEKSFARRNVKVRTRTAFRGLEHSGDGVVVNVEGEKGEEEIRCDRVLLAVGRKAQTEGLGLEAAGVEVDRGFVKTAANYQTTQPTVWAIGDVIGPPLLAHKASEEGVAAAEFIAGERSKPVDLNLVPACIYCQPQVASVGLTEAQARAAGHEVRVGKMPFTAVGKAVAVGHTEGMVKLVSDARYGEILGAQIMGHGATELIAEIAMSMILESTVREVGDACHAHPTLSEAIKEAALAADGRSLNF